MARHADPDRSRHLKKKKHRIVIRRSLERRGEGTRSVKYWAPGDQFDQKEGGEESSRLTPKEKVNYHTNFAPKGQGKGIQERLAKSKIH